VQEPDRGEAEVEARAGNVESSASYLEMLGNGSILQLSQMRPRPFNQRITNEGNAGLGEKSGSWVSGNDRMAVRWQKVGRPEVLDTLLSLQSLMDTK
jgi:hypothetical protein